MKLNNKRIIYIGFIFLLIQMFWQVYDNVIAKILVDSFGLSNTASGVVMALDNAFAVVLLPFFGLLSDKTKSKHGRRTPYIFIGTVLAALLIMGVSFFDNAQIAKVKEAEIPAIETIEVKNIEHEIPFALVTEVSNDGEIKEVGLVNKNFLLKEGYTKIYQFNHPDKLLETQYYHSKDAASLVRRQLVAEVRNENMGFLIGFLVVLCLVLVAMSIFRTPAVSLMPDVTPKPLRSKANAIINLMGCAGGIIALIYMNFTAIEFESYTLTFVILGVLMLVFLALYMWKVHENKFVEDMIKQSKEYGIEETIEVETTKEKMPRDVKISFLLILLSVVLWYMAYNAATSKFSVYATQALDMKSYSMALLVAQAAAIVCYIPLGMLSNKFGRKSTVLVGVVILFVAFLCATFARDNTTFIIWIALALAGIGWATINVNSYPMIVEMAKGSDVGKYTGIYYTFSMCAQIITPILSGFFMDSINIYALFPYCTICAGLAFVTMFFVKHGDSKPIPSSKLESFEAMDD